MMTAPETNSHAKTAADGTRLITAPTMRAAQGAAAEKQMPAMTGNPTGGIAAHLSSALVLPTCSAADGKRPRN
jgi:hypothetical protein